MAAGQALEIDLVLGCAATSVAARDSTGVGPWNGAIAQAGRRTRPVQF